MQAPIRERLGIKFHLRVGVGERVLAEAVGATLRAPHTTFQALPQSLYFSTELFEDK